MSSNKSQSPFEHGGLSQDPRYDPDSLHYGGYRHESGASEYHVPLPSYHLNQQPFSHSTGELAALNRQATRGRSESDGYRSMSARSSEDRAPLTTFFGTQAWQRLSTNLPSGVRDPLNIDELEREERLMMPPYGRQGGLSAPAIQPVSSMPTNAASRSHLNSSMYGSQPYQSSSGHATGEKQGSRHISEISTSFLNSNAGGSNGVPMLSEKTGSSGSALPAPPLDWAYIQDHNLRNGGLPSLDQVLTRRTRAPLALRDFAVHCSVRQPQARRWLEFYMAARTHEKMCLAYESDLRHAKARSHYASADSRILPDRFNSGLPGSLSGAIAGEKEKHRSSKYTHKSDIHELSDAQKRAAAHTATIESLSRGRATTEPPGDDPLLYPEDDIQATPQPPHSQGGAKSGFHRSHRQSTRMALQIQTAAETIFLRYFRAALDPNLLQGGSPSYWPTNMMPKVHGGIGGAHDDSGKMGSLKRMLTQRAAGAGGPRSKNPKGLHLAQNTLRPTFDDPYHQGYGVAATDSVYVSAVGTNNTNDPAGNSGRHSGAGSEYNNKHGELASPTSLVMSREHLTKPITGDGMMMPQAGNHQQQLMRLHQGSGLSGTLGGSRRHLYYHMPWPPEILTDIEQRLLHDGAALDSKLFSEALLYAYDVLDTYYFPIFISDATSRNVTRDHCILRVFIAFVLLWFGFALPLALILLDHDPKATRIWCLIPQLIGWWNMSVGFGGCDLLLAAMRKYQSPALKAPDPQGPARPPTAGRNKHASKDTFDSARTKKSKTWLAFLAPSSASHVGGWRRAWFSTRVSVDLTATRMVRARSIRWFIGALLMTAISTAILSAVPGTRIYSD